MRAFWFRILALLDGADAVQPALRPDAAPPLSADPDRRKAGTRVVWRAHGRERGQSVVEMALITPILIILFAGLVEIGWFANNYLTLLDVTRAGARRGTALTGENNPVTSWNNLASLVPPEALPAEYQMPYGSVPPSTEELLARFGYRDTMYLAAPRSSTGCNSAVLRGFYNEIACTMVRSMEPLRLDPTNGIDDIVISGFAVDNVDARPAGYAVYGAHPVTGQVPKMVVVGRYPTNANECDVSRDPVTGTVAVSAQEPRDPFDWNANNTRDLDRGAPGTLPEPAFIELIGYDAVAGNATNAEKQIGFVWYGNHRLEDTACIGSEWTIADVETLFNLPDYSIDNDARREAMPGQGLVLVEMFWQHTLLLQIPVLSPVFDILGDRTTIAVWAAFPVPAFEPTTFYYCNPQRVTPCPNY